MRRPPRIPLLFGYVGQKRGLVRCYPPPLHSLIVEPFAGSAGYAREWGAGRDVILVERARWLADMWTWLVQASRQEVMGLPMLHQIPRGGLSEIKDLRPEARDLIGLHLNLSNHPSNVPSKLALLHQFDGQKDYWNKSARKAIADSLGLMRHWKVIRGNYDRAPEVTATWFVDPPYQRLPDMYSERVADYSKLADWCRLRDGQVIVCEDMSADWLDFRPLDTSSRSRKSTPSAANTGQHNTHREAVWVR